VNWRPDPTTGARTKADTGDWPRNGAVLRGTTHDVAGTPWLAVSAIKQAGKAEFVSVEGQGKWMGFDGGPFNGGRWLHKPGEEPKR